MRGKRGGPQRQAATTHNNQKQEVLTLLFSQREFLNCFVTFACVLDCQGGIVLYTGLLGSLNG